MSEFCFVVERVEWEEDHENLTVGFEVSEILRVFKNAEDMKTYVERNAAANYPTFDFQWHGESKYSACSKVYGSGWREGVAYKIRYVPLD